MTATLYYLVTFMVAYITTAERISNVESPTWNRHTTTDDYSYSGRDRASSYDRDESVRGVGSGSDRLYGGVGTERPFTYSWERDRASTRSSYLDRFTTQSSFDDRDRYDRYDYTSRRPSYQTDRWGDVIGGTTAYRSPYVTWSATDRPDRYGSSWDRTTSRYGGSSYTTRGWGGSSGSGSRDWDTGSSSFGASSGRYDRNEAYVRIHVELLKLTNEKGLQIDGSKCDTLGQCDPIFKAYLDTERPNAEFPGSRDSKYWPVIFQTDDNNSPDIRNGTLVRDVCGVPYRDCTLRVLVEDRDTLNANDIINKFDCTILREPDSSETMSTWHSGVCSAKQQSDKMKLTFRYKVYVIPRSRCDPTSGSLPGGASTPRTTKRY